MGIDFDVHEHRHRLKLVRDSGDTALFENRDDVVCPTCTDPFDRLLVIRAESTCVRENDGSPFCLRRLTDGMAVFTH